MPFATQIMAYKMSKVTPLSHCSAAVYPFVCMPSWGAMACSALQAPTLHACLGNPLHDAYADQDALALQAALNMREPLSPYPV